MRFAVAFVTLLLAGVLIAAGIAQRTVLKPADHVTAAATVPSGVRYVVVPGSVLRAHTGRQQLHLAGGGQVFAAYGSSADVTAWLSGQRYAELRVDGSGALRKPVVRTAPVVNGLRGGTPDPDGSDLWMDQRTAQRALTWNVNVPDSVSVLVAADGAAPAPSSVKVTWPVRTATPLAVPMIAAGGILAVLGLLLYIWALVHDRRSRGPRRKSPPKMPKRPQPPRYRPQRPASAAPVPGRGRRSVRRRTALAATGGLAALLGGLLAPGPAGAATAPGSGDPAVSEQQASRIVQRVAEVSAAADARRSAKVAAGRFAGPALELRDAAYTIRKADRTAKLPQTVPLEHADLELILPEAAVSWPRTLFVVVGDKRSSKIAPLALALVQDDPRAEYKVHYAMSLMPSTTLPTLPSALRGATRLRPEAAVLSVAPGRLAADYGAVLQDAQASTAKEFDLAHDELVTGVGEAAKKKVAKKLGATAGITFKDLPPDPSSVIALSTAASGALVAVPLDERWTVKPKRGGVTVRPSGGTRILSKVSSTAKGIQSVYGYQLLFSVPSAGSNEPVRLLGYAQGLVSAKEL